MEEVHGKPATISPKIGTESNLSKGNPEIETPSQRRPTSSTDLAIESISGHSSSKPEPTTDPPERTLEVSKIAVKVPRNRRRGLFAQLTFLAEIEDAYEFPHKTKWFIVGVVAYAAAAAPLGSAIIFRVSQSISLPVLMWAEVTPSITLSSGGRTRYDTDNRELDGGAVHA